MHNQLLDLAVVVPAYNEAGRITGTIEEILQYGRNRGWRFEVVVVDDGSTDATAAVIGHLAERYDELRLIQQPSNRGKGHAVRSGVLSSSARRILFVDADGATPIGEYERLAKALDEGASLAVGSRAVASDEVAVDARWYRRVMGRTFQAMVRLLTGVAVQDTQCGFKLFDGASARALFGRSRIDRFAFDVELLVLAHTMAFEVAEVPVNWRHVPGSRINLVTDSLRMMVDVLRIRQIHRVGRQKWISAGPR